MSGAERVYGLLLLAYPREFRREYGREAANVFARLYRDARQRGARAVIALWRRTVPVVLFAGLRERAEERAARRAAERSRSGAPHGGVGGGAERVWREARIALRSMLRRPGFAVTAILLIALGVGATTTMFSVVDAVLLRALPYPDSDRLFSLSKDGSAFPLQDFVDVRENVQAFDAMGGVWAEAFDLTGEGDPERLPAGLVTRDLLPVLGARAWRGRLFADEEYRPGAPRVVVIGADLWVRRWAGDPSVVGRTVMLSGQPALVIGVLDPDFLPPEALRLRDVDILAPLDLTRADAQDRHIHVLDVVARLGPGVRMETARAQLDALAARYALAYPDTWADDDGTMRRVRLTPLHEATIGDIGQALWMFLGAVGLMLLIACANVASLFLARATEREHEMAVRAALGAGRGRIITQVLTEGLLLALAGGAVGVGLAWLGVSAFRHLDPGGIPRIAEIGVDARVVAFALVLSALTAMLFALWPAWSSSRADAGSTLRESGMRATSTRLRARMRNGLVVVEIGLAVVLLAGAGVLFHSFLRLRSVEVGFDPTNLMTVKLDVASTVEPGRRAEFVDRFTERMLTMPGVRAVGASWRLPFEPGHCCWRVHVVDPTMPGDSSRPTLHPVTPGYFEALGIAITRGRGFEPADRNYGQIPGPMTEHLPPPRAIPVVISRAVAEQVWPGADPIGRQLLFDRRELTFTVVGVVEPVRHWGYAEEPDAEAYLPYDGVTGWPLGLLDIGIRHDGRSPEQVGAAARAVLRELAPDLPIREIASMEERMSGSVATPRFYATLLTTFAGIAFLLAAAGVYGSMLYMVGMRRREMGIRLALGAASRDVVRIVLARGALLVITGTALGITAALASTRVLRSLVFDLSVTDPVSFTLAAGLLAAVAMLACWVPARRAGRVDPVTMLRVE
jgi:putative ABC transport system permease protein